MLKSDIITFLDIIKEEDPLLCFTLRNTLEKDSMQYAYRKSALEILDNAFYSEANKNPRIISFEAIDIIDYF